MARVVKLAKITVLIIQPFAVHFLELVQGKYDFTTIYQVNPLYFTEYFYYNLPNIFTAIYRIFSVEYCYFINF